MTSIALIENGLPLLPIKTDKAGRRRLSSEHKEALLDAFEESSMSGAQFSKKYGLVYPTFASWVKKRKELKENQESGSSSLNRFVEVALKNEESSGGLVVELSQGARIQINESGHIALAAALIKTLSE